MEHTVDTNNAPPDPREIKPVSALTAMGIPFIRIAHPAAYTMELCRGIGAEYGAEHCKNLFLTNRSGSDFHLLLMRADKTFRTSEVSRLLGVSRLSFASDEQLKSVLGLEGGSVSVLGLLNDCSAEAYKSGRLHIAVDAELLKRERICVHPNVNTATLVIAAADIEKLLKNLGFEYKTVCI